MFNSGGETKKKLCLYFVSQKKKERKKFLKMSSNQQANTPEETGSETSSTDTAVSDQKPLVAINTERTHQADVPTVVLAEVCETAATNMLTSVGPTPLTEDTTPAPSTAQFHIPSSNMSETGYSECSFPSEHFFQGRQALTKTESLSARQQVALWLTRTSMTDLSSVPSLKSLVQAGTTQTQTTPTEKSPRVPFKNIIQRNYSAKSLVGNLSFGFGKGGKGGTENSETEETDKMMHSPIRKCETVLALSGMKTPSCCPSRAPTPSTVAAAGGSAIYPCCSSAASCSGSQRNSSFNLFARLSVENRAGSRRLPVHHTHSTPVGTMTPHARSIIGDAYNGSGCESPFPGIRPFNRLRPNSSMMCSRCTSVLSVNVSRMTSQMTSRAPSQMSLFPGNRRLSAAVTADKTVVEEKEAEQLCKICLIEYPPKEMAKLQTCGCIFCKECMAQYVTFEVMSGSYDISCPDPDCEGQGILQLVEVEALAGKDVMDKHKRYRLNTEVALDKDRAWCPQAGCETICHICSTANSTGPVDVKCPSCQKEFCSLCSATWHPGMSCEENGKALVKRAGTSASLSGMLGSGGDSVLVIGGMEIKRCPMCQVPIERDTGCAQMMCKRCKHVFCWYCLESLDDDFLLRHYDSGACKGQLGHSRASVLWHRVQVIGIFAAFGLLLLMASPCLLVVAPCVLCCGYKSCKTANETVEEQVPVKLGETSPADLPPLLK